MVANQLTKLIILSTVLVYTTCVEGVSQDHTRHTGHPFVGQHEGKSYIEHGDGSISIRMTQQQTPHNKHSDKTLSTEDFGPKFSMSEWLLGHDISSQKWLNKIKSETAVKSDRLSNGHHRLGQGQITSTLDTVDGVQWTGTIYMGRLYPMDVIFDTGSDYLVIEGSDCVNCQGDTYDIQSSSLS